MKDYQSAIAVAAPGTEVHLLDSSQDAIAQITNTLLGREGIASIHVVSHRKAGGLDFGTGKLNLSDLPQYAAQLQTWSKALTDDADILLYGCNVAEGELGKAFTSILSQLTGADVATLNDLAGSASKGNWTLEYQTGQIESGLAWQPQALAHYSGVLDSTRLSNFSFPTNSSLPASLTNVNGTSYFTANDPTNGDYAATANTLTFNPGDSTKTITVNGNGDTRVEQNETFQVKLAAPTNATIAAGTGTGTTVNDDRKGADYNSDGNIDLLWRNPQTGQDIIWLLNGTSFSTDIALPSIQDVSWSIQGTSDFDGDGDTDLLWRNLSTGQNAIWLLNGTTYSTTIPLPTIADTSWSIVGMADFNNDSSTDILWRNRATGENTIWALNGTTYSTFTVLPRITTPGWQIKGTADFDGDGAAEILWRNAFTGENVIWKLNGFTYSTSVALPTLVGRNWTIAGLGDFDRNGTPDLVWRNIASGQNMIWKLNGMTYSTYTNLPTVEQPGWTIKTIADFDGDGSSDIFWHDTSTGQDVIWKLNGTTYSTYTSLPTSNDPNWVIF